MKYLFTLLILSLFASCVMPGDLREMELNWADLESGFITLPEFKERNEAIMEEIEARNQAIKDQGLPTDPISIISYLAGAAATIYGTNKIRDKRRTDGTDVKKAA